MCQLAIAYIQTLKEANSTVDLLILLIIHFYFIYDFFHKK